MSLSDRLAAAARLRDAASSGQSLPGADPLGEAEPVDVRVEISIMLPPDGPVSMAPRDPAADPGSLCPTCNRPGELGLVDLHRQTTDWQCTTCGTMWRARDTTPAPVAAEQRLLPPMRG